MRVFCSHVRGLIFRYSTANSCKQSNIKRYSTTYHFEGVIKEHARGQPVFLCTCVSSATVPVLFQKI